MTVRFPNSRLFLALNLALLLSFSSCLRYVPSFSDDSETNAEGKTLVGEEAFFEYDNLQAERLKSLIEERTSKSKNGFVNDYHIGPGDVVDLAVAHLDELNVTVPVRPSGLLSLPVVGIIEAAGLTEPELEEELRKKLQKFVRNPDVRVFISEYAAHTVSVIGQVNDPGSYALSKDSNTLIELLTKAGGKTASSASSVILVPSSEESSQRRFLLGTDADLSPPSKDHSGVEIPLDDVLGEVSTARLEVPIQPGDTIIVPLAGTVQVAGEVKSPGSYELSSRTTVLGAIASAGGLTYSADVSEVEVIRELGSGKKALLAVDLEELAIKKGTDVRLRHGDVIRVPSQPSRFVTRQLVDVINSFVSFGLRGAP